VQRVVDTMTEWGKARTAISRPMKTGENFRWKLAHLMLTQKACFQLAGVVHVGVKEARGYG